MEAILLIGGFGTRLSPITNKINKHEIILGDKPIWEHSLLNIIKSGIEKIHKNF